MLIALLSLFTASAENLKTIYYWEKSPSIEIWPESNVTINEIQVALNYWQSKNNYRLLYVNKVSECLYEKFNTIQITNGDRIVDNSLATTNVSWYYYPKLDPQKNVKYVSNAIINIPINLKKSRQDIITHELGHAFGLDHSDHPIMKEYF